VVAAFIATAFAQDHADAAKAQCIPPARAAARRLVWKGVL
jgi:hypothetical protein